MSAMVLELDIPQKESVTPPEQHQNWVAAHPFSAGILLAIALFLIGAFIVARNTPADPQVQHISAWGGIGNLLQSDLQPAPQGSSDIMQAVQENPPYSYTIPSLSISQKPQGGTGDTEASQTIPDYTQTLNSLESGQHIGAPPPQWGTTIYDPAPDSLFSADTTHERTPTQQALFNYGNELGAYIQSFEQAHQNMTQVLKDQIEDRENTQKADLVRKLGDDFAKIGSYMLTMEDVPAPIAAAHETLAQSYKEIGQKLSLVPSARTDEQFLDAIGVYNASADQFAKNFVTFVQVFSSNKVQFSNSDAGSIFMFTFTGEVQ